MNDSILDSVKLTIGGIEPSDTSFDNDILIHINTVLTILRQLGLTNKITVTSNKEKWSDITDNEPDLDSIKTYISLKVKKAFDPPSGSSAMTALNELINELEFRLNIAMDN